MALLLLLLSLLASKRSVIIQSSKWLSKQYCWFRHFQIRINDKSNMKRGAKKPSQFQLSHHPHSGVFLGLSKYQNLIIQIMDYLLLVAA